jgi:serine protease Do
VVDEVDNQGANQGPVPARPVTVKKASLRLARIRLAGIAFLLLLCLSLGFLGGWLGSRGTSFHSNTPEVRQQVMSSESQLISEIAKNVGPSVVSVNVTSQTSSFFGTAQGESAGTGFIISADGVIVTNRHVVAGNTQSVSVTMSDGTKFSGVAVLGQTNDGDPLDIAFLKIKDLGGKKVTPVKLGDSSKVQVGDKVVAIGNALGQFQNTVTSGIISGYGRSVQAGDELGGSSEDLQNLFQTDTAINQGNSGGPLVNTSGEVIGINTAVAGNAENIGFAIPINDVQGLINSVLKQGKLLRPYLGVRYVSLTDDISYQYNLNVKRGAYLAPSGEASVVAGSPADKAGLQEKDIITKIDGVAIDENNSLTSVLGRHSVGDKVTLTVIRDGKEISLTAKLEAAPSQNQ